MKKNILMIAVLALSALSMVSCKKDKVSENENGMTTIFARMDSPKAGGEKTYLGSLGEDGKTPTYWSANDKVAVFEGIDKYEYTLSGGKDTSKASFTGPVLATGASHCAFYPYDESENLNATTGEGSFTVNFDLPQIQTYKEGSFNEGTCPMVAYSNDENFNFLNMTGVLKLHIEGTGIVGKIVLKDNSTQTPLWGSATVTVENGTKEPAMTVSNDAAGCNELILNCPGGVDISASGGKDFYFVLPTGVLSNGFKVDVYNTSHTSIEIDKSAVHGNIILRSIISTMKLENVTAPVDGLLPGKFSIGNGKQVQFSKGNLQLNPSTKTWRFAENQYDYVGNSSRGNVYYNGAKCNNEEISTQYTGWIDLFGFGDHDGENIKNTEYYANGSNFEDWGNEINDGTDGWYTFTRDEMICLLNNRKNAAGTLTGADYRGHATITIDGKACNGLVILPDDFAIPQDFVSDASSGETTSYSENTYTLQEWSVMEAQGAVFFPASGYRSATENNDYVTAVGMGVHSYWTKTCNDLEKKAGRYFFNASGITLNQYSTTYNGCAVRLVRDVR